MKQLSLAFTFAAFLSCASAHGAIEFDLRSLVDEGGGTLTLLDDDDDTDIVLTQGGITATLTALVDGVVDSNSVFNVTGSGFGINANGGGDDTDQLDGPNGIESVSMTFDVDLTFDDLSVSSFGVDDRASLTIGSFTPVVIDQTGTTSFTMNNSVTAGETVVLAFSAGNGFSFDSFTVSAVTAAIPEPTSMLAWSGLALAAGVMSARSRRA